MTSEKKIEHETENDPNKKRSVQNCLKKKNTCNRTHLKNNIPKRKTNENMSPVPLGLADFRKSSCYTYRYMLRLLYSVIMWNQKEEKLVT